MAQGNFVNHHRGQRRFNEIVIEGDVARIVTKHGDILIDAADVPAVSGSAWSVVNMGRGHFYAVRTMRSDETGGSRYLHRFLTDAPKGRHVDHINHNGLDNRRSNLRVVEPWVNQLNRKETSGRTSSTGIRGVYRWKNNAGRDYYMARVEVARYFPHTEEGLQQAGEFAEEVRRKLRELDLGE